MSEQCFDCVVCGGKGFSIARRDNHLKFWCSPAAAPDLPQQVFSEGPQEMAKKGTDCTDRCVEQGSASSQDFREACLRPSYHTRCEVSVKGLSLDLQLELQSVFGEISTAGGVWPPALLMGEWVADYYSKKRNDSNNNDGWVMELGCGVAPVAGLCSAACGENVLLCDLSMVLCHTRRNVSINHANLKKVSLRRMCAAGSIEVAALPWGDPLPADVKRLIEGGGGLKSILCADLVYSKKLIPLLCDSLRQLIDFSILHNRDEKPAFAVLAFSRREGYEEELLGAAMEAQGLEASQTPPREVDALLQRVEWPKRLRNRQKIPEDFIKIVRITRKRSAKAAMQTVAEQ